MSDLKQAALLLQQGELQQAEAIYRKILTAQPEHGIALWGLGCIASAVGHSQGAIALLSRAAQALPDNAMPLLDLGQALEDAGRYTEAGSAWNLAVQVAPEDANAAVALAAHLEVMGQLDTARNEWQRAIDLAPRSAAARAGQSRLHSFAGDAPELKAMRTLLDDVTLGDGDRSLLHYALADSSHRLQRYDDAFEHWQQGNLLDHARCSFTVADMKPFFTQLQTVFNAEGVRALGSGEASLTPVFIVGQPRSGSTLLEQMLSSHSTVEAAGEVPFLGRDTGNALRQMTGQTFPQGSSELTGAQAEQLAELYLQRLQERAPGARFITDKLPANYQSVGWIHRLMPHAKVIYLQRDPLDLCFSIYRNHFRAAEPYFNTLVEIGHYQVLHEQVMRHWQQVLPGFVHTLRYEDLVAEPERELSHILDFCGLNWEPQCLDFHRNPRPVATLSRAQVRKPLAAATVPEWQPYEARLQPLRRALDGAEQRYSR